MTKKEQRIIGWIDDIICLSDALYKEKIDLHDQDKQSITYAMKRLKSSDSLSWLLTRKTTKQWEEDRAAISIAVKSLTP